MPGPRATAGVLALTILVVGSFAAAAEQAETIRSTELRERVEVRYVLLDALVLDDAGRIVRDLEPDDFELYLDLERHPVESVDPHCPRGAEPAPRAIPPGKRRHGAISPRVARRIALVLDLDHLAQTRRPEILNRVRAMVRQGQVDAEERMVASVGDRLRVEQPFTDDPEAVRAALDRMGEDPALWQERPYARRQEFATFEGLADLVRMMSVHDGPKAIVLVSDMPSKVEDAEFSRPLGMTPPAFDYDRQFETLAAAATEARVPIYPIEARGLKPGASSDRLARIAVESGGRFTRNTNDLSLAYARAQRDLACRYTIGFKDTDPDPGKLHRVDIRVRRRGTRVHHPVYLHRSRPQRPPGRRRSRHTRRSGNPPLGSDRPGLQID